MSTIERLAELAKKATQGEWGSHDHGVAEIVVYAKDTFFAICCFEGNYAFVENDIKQHTADANYIAECNPAAIAQAAAEYAAVVAERDALRARNAEESPLRCEVVVRAGEYGEKEMQCTKRAGHFGFHKFKEEEK